MRIYGKLLFHVFLCSVAKAGYTLQGKKMPRLEF